MGNFDVHAEMLGAYESRLLNQPEWLESVLSRKGVLESLGSIFSLGIGPGGFESKLLAMYPGSRLSYVERNLTVLKELDRNLRRYRVEERIQNGFIDSFEHIADPDRYDLVLSLDSWYHIGKNEELLAKALKMRRAGGKLLIELMTKQSLYWSLDRTRGLPSAEEISVWATDKGFEHEYFEEGLTTEYSTLIDKDGPKDPFKRFVAFATGSHWDEMTHASRERAVDSLIAANEDGIVRTTYGFLLFEG